MRTIEVNLYQFNELSDSAKEVVRNWYREAGRGDNFFAEYVIDDAIELGKLMGFDFKTRGVKLHGGGMREKPCIYWSGFSSQGDGACFEASWSAKAVQTGKIKENAPTDKLLGCVALELERIALIFPTATFTVSHQGRYYHKNSTDFDISITDNEGQQIDTLQTAAAALDLIANTKDFMGWIYRQLERAYDYEQSNEAVDENIVANGYEFTIDGKRA